MSQPGLPKDEPDTSALPIGDEKDDAKKEDERGKGQGDAKNGKEGPEDDLTGSVASHDSSINSTPRPPIRQDTPWPQTAPDPIVLLAMMANMQPQVVDLLANQKNTPAPAPEPAPV
ncbi:hypothetical protein L198_06008 [Cryptococcus wingfieldii CBS 7118]|uniref:Uncharacterized protein n=1 Tax=Cryptococcus wingfieldii CBS 7118 TaxID=1295528 RepID=A0A1E3ISH9_9TREE|nr:hypothetical protein L198_06008 [Cryptococcus wingfieldii CBS 7118]ODN91488.1 hypothetical protein L198_06008 [Cryptococcus wingfieldii CBS 7118]